MGEEHTTNFLKWDFSLIKNSERPQLEWKIELYKLSFWFYDDFDLIRPKSFFDKVKELYIYIKKLYFFISMEKIRQK